ANIASGGGAADDHGVAGCIVRRAGHTRGAVAHLVLVADVAGAGATHEHVAAVDNCIVRRTVRVRARAGLAQVAERTTTDAADISRRTERAVSRAPGPQRAMGPPFVTLLGAVELSIAAVGEVEGNVHATMLSGCADQRMRRVINEWAGLCRAAQELIARVH